ncbi:aspartyl/asparaginyl beta-hydroxylase domain-containing protein [Hyphomonas sp. WL0036]|uniref:aspartyl/asparaginyl beta-hydroxylase domain-containing protein n=1 Tax=Hyphomonas sediminis TaxID=2866160 RepID=UPI001C81E8F1|nr:aspartyl/asparaginyl beta-hydroxylase domain-containing protein [Hyphomonas sediminis]MBY9067611.1 aspartyl/asparaginyl beta-hydroxylase domain-containing protein [Hyphomonas sediminis]
MTNSTHRATISELVDTARMALLPGGNAATAVIALQEALLQAPRDIGLILFLGDAQHAAGQRKQAGQSYGVALRLASQIASSSIPPGIQEALNRAGDRRNEYARQYEAFLRSKLTGGGESSRFSESLEILFGRRQIYVQQPTKFYFPGLPQIQFYNTDLFDWAADLEAKTDSIRHELLNVMADEAAFAPYLPEEDKTSAHVRSVPLQGSLDWAAFYIWQDGQKVATNAARCPVTASAFDKVPLDFLPGQAPSVLFSRLKPGAHIPPHCGLINTRLIGHLPLIVPGPAWLRVGNEVHYWKEGKLVVFDDSIEHEAKNEATETRVVLLFDFWRPEITLPERQQISELISAIAEYSGEAVARES